MPDDVTPDTPAPAPEPPAPSDRAPAGGWAYVGPAYIPGIPARALTADDVAALEREGVDLKSVLATGVYRASPSAAKALADADKE